MIKGLMYKRLFNWILVAIFFAVLSWASYSYISAKTEVKTFDATLALVSNILNEKSFVGGLSSAFDNLFNLAMLQILSFLILTCSLLFLLWFLFRIYSIEKRDALIDPLTDVYNRRSILLGLKHELDRAKKFNHKLTIAIVDIDYFRKYNVLNGSILGDKVLRKISRVINKEIRSTDLIGRMGGEEFLIIFPETNYQTAFRICEKIRKTIENLEFINTREMPNGKLTISIGVSEFNSELHSKRNEHIILDADRRLYVAKLAGRNTIR